MSKIKYSLHWKIAQGGWRKQNLKGEPQLWNYMEGKCIIKWFNFLNNKIHACPFYSVKCVIFLVSLINGNKVHVSKVKEFILIGWCKQNTMNQHDYFQKGLHVLLHKNIIFIQMNFGIFLCNLL
jgi:hypothetical protein